MSINTIVSEIAEKLRKNLKSIKRKGIRKEDDITNKLASVLGARLKVVVDRLEIDLVLNGIPIEVEYNKNFYEGFCQVVAYKIVTNAKDGILIHFLDDVSKEFLEKITTISKILKIPAIIVNLRREEVYECCP